MPAPGPGQSEQRYAHEGNHIFLVVPLEGISDPAAPTVAELTDTEVFDVTRYVPKTNGVAGDPTENYIDSGDVSSEFDSQQVGSYGEQLTLQMFMQRPDNNAYEFFTYGDTFYFVDIYNAAGSDPADGDEAVVRKVECHQPKPLPFAPNEKQRFQMGLAVLEKPEYAAVVVAGTP